MERAFQQVITQAEDCILHSSIDNLQNVAARAQHVAIQCIQAMNTLSDKVTINDIFIPTEHRPAEMSATDLPKPQLFKRKQNQGRTTPVPPPRPFQTPPLPQSAEHRDYPAHIRATPQKLLMPPPPPPLPRLLRIKLPREIILILPLGINVVPDSRLTEPSSSRWRHHSYRHLQTS